MSTYSTLGTRYTWYMMDDAWYVYDKKYCKLADSWGLKKHCSSKSEVMKHVNRMNKEEDKKGSPKPTGRGTR